MKYSLGLLALLSFSLSAQQQSKHTCSHAKSNRFQTRSNTFTVQQIAETERYDVHYYFLNLHMTNTVTTLSGLAEIHASARENLDSALIELYPTLTINGISVNGTPVAYSRVATAVKIPVNAAAGQSFILSVDYAGTPPTAASNPLGGGGMTNASSPSWGNQVTWSLSEPFSAYEWFPVKQSLKDKADSSAVFVTVPDACKAGSNGILEQVVDLGNGTHRFEWHHRHPIDYYLISVAVAEYVEYNVTANTTSGPVTIQNYIYNNPQTLPFFQNDIDETADFIELFDTIFGPYPFADEKYGHCMAPLGGGMEHQTMTTQGFFEKSLTAHELAHQWWGDLTTCASWADIWVNEGFASYAEHIMLENLYPGQETGDMQQRHNNIMSQAGGSVWVEDSLDENRIFSGRLSYDKGAAIIHTLRFLINNDQLFYQGMRNYLSQFADSTALGTDFIGVMENTTGMDFTDFTEQWYFGEGFPIYTVRWNDTGGNILVEINQQTSMPSVTPVFTNDLELRFDRQGLPDTNYRFTINGTQNQFLIPNPDGTIVNILSIDPDNWICNGNLGITKDLDFVAGIEEQESTPVITVFPNPSEGPVNVSMAEEGHYLLTVIDTRGRVLITQSFTQQTQFDLGQAASGTYLLQVSSTDGTKSRKVLKR